MARITTADEVLAGTPMAVSLRSTRELVTGAWRTVRPVRPLRASPCNLDCPAGTDVRAWLRLAADGDIEGAWRTMLEHNPLPAVCGRVCHHPCEQGCHRSALDEPIAVQAIERSIADEVRRLHLRIERPGPTVHARHVAIIGAGPAGISCAYHLARRGHLPTMFEAMPQAGGRLRYGIPRERLPQDVLDAELETLWDVGVGFQGNARFGSTLTWEDLSAYAAVFIAIGANAPIGGEKVNVHAFAPVVDTDDSGRIYADGWGRTTLPAIFAGGAATMGAGEVVNAIGSGRKAAEGIDAWLAGRDPVEAEVAERVAPGDLNLFYFPRAPRLTSDVPDGDWVRAGIDGAGPGLGWPNAVREARRCLSCGSCTECDTCLTFCPEAAIHHDTHTRSYRVDDAHCKGCGICATECPRGAVVLVPAEA